ncbi:MAG: TraR/DksA C4-type zinc finger protein [Actinomycetales bacterium]|nr:TraR/DksA C4-type zinc finger protein [Actinomycetales bacterium]
MAVNTREVLLSKRDEVTALITDLTSRPDSAMGPSRNRGERSGLAGERHSRAATVEGLLREGADIDRALIKIEHGTYGLCDECGSLIAAGRLDIRPWAVRCVHCGDHC